MASHFVINVKVPLKSDSFSDQAEAVGKLSAAIGVFRKALAAQAPDHDYVDMVVKERDANAPRRGRRKASETPAPAAPLPEAAE